MGEYESSGEAISDLEVIEAAASECKAMEEVSIACKSIDLVLEGDISQSINSVQDTEHESPKNDNSPTIKKDIEEVLVELDSTGVESDCSSHKLVPITDDCTSIHLTEETQTVEPANKDAHVVEEYIISDGDDSDYEITCVKKNDIVIVIESDDVPVITSKDDIDTHDIQVNDNTLIDNHEKDTEEAKINDNDIVLVSYEKNHNELKRRDKRKSCRKLLSIKKTSVESDSIENSCDSDVEIISEKPSNKSFDVDKNIEVVDACKSIEEMDRNVSPSYLSISNLNIETSTVFDLDGNLSHDSFASILFPSPLESNNSVTNNCVQYSDVSTTFSSMNNKMLTEFTKDNHLPSINSYPCDNSDISNDQNVGHYDALNKPCSENQSLGVYLTSINYDPCINNVTLIKPVSVSKNDNVFHCVSTNCNPLLSSDFTANTEISLNNKNVNCSQFNSSNGFVNANPPSPQKSSNCENTKFGFLGKRLRCEDSEMTDNETCSKCDVNELISASTSIPQKCPHKLFPSSSFQSYRCKLPKYEEQDISPSDGHRESNSLILPIKKRVTYSCSKCWKNSEYKQFSFCDNLHPTCKKCIAAIIKDLLSKSFEQNKICPQDDCSAAYSRDELLKSVPEMIVDILEEKTKEDEIKKIMINLKEGTLGGINFLDGLPDHWYPQGESNGYKIIQLNSDEPEFLQLAIRFYATMYFPNAEVSKIYRVQNPVLWHFYSVKKAQMIQEAGSGIDPNEAQLFHGTKHAHLNAILKNNFDWRLCGGNGVTYGQGSYFARDAVYSHRYCDSLFQGSTLESILPASAFCNDKTSFVASSNYGNPKRKKFFLIIAKVLIGSYTHGHSKLRKPPCKDPNDITSDKFFDSCVDDITDPKIHVVFDASQAYPEYILEYTNMPPVVKNWTRV